MRQSITLASGSTTEPFLVDPDGWVVIEAGSTSVTFEYTIGTPADIAAGSATWLTLGALTGFTAVRSDEELADTYVKLTASGGSITYHVEGVLSKADRLTLRGYKRLGINNFGATYALDSSGNVTGLVGPDGGLVSLGETAPLRIAATRGETPLTAVASTTDRTRFTSRSRHKLDGGGLTSITAGWSNFYLAGTRVETNNANAATLRAHIEIPGAPTPVVVFAFSAASSVVLAAGEGLKLADEISPSAFGLTTFAAGTTCYIVSEITVSTVGHTFLRSLNSEAASGEGGWFGNPATDSSIGVAGALSTPAGGSSTSTLYYPTVVVGRHINERPSVALLGSSLVTGQTDNAGFGLAGGGFYVRGLYDIDGTGQSIGWVRQAVGGTTALQASTNYTKQALAWAYATHMICDLGSNDGSGGQTAVNTLAKFRTIAAAAKAAGVQRFEQQLCINRCNTSSDSWATAANMTPLSGFETGGAFKDPLNALVLADVNGNSGVASAIDAALDVSFWWADPTLTDRVRGTYSTDGVHPSTVSAPLMQAAVAARARQWVVK